MYFASQNFTRANELRRAFQQGVTITLFNPNTGIPAVNGEVTVVGPWKLLDNEDMSRAKAGWQARCTVKNMDITHVYIEQHERRTTRRRVKAGD